MQENEQVVELDLKALLFYILRQWKSMVTFALIIALLLAALMGFLEYRTGLEVDMTNDYWVEYQRYEDQLALYRNQLTTAQGKITTLQDYIDNSVLMSADPQDIYIAQATYFIDTDYKILPENTYQTPDRTGILVSYYRDYLMDYSVYEEIGQIIGLEPKYLTELVKVTTGNSAAGKNAATVSNEALSISVGHPSEATALIIMTALQQKMDQVYDHLQKTVDQHKVTVMTNTLGSYVSSELSTYQQTTRAELETYQNSILTARQELYKLEKDGGPGELSIPIAMIKGIILGGVLGGVLAFVWFFVLAILQGRVMAPEQLVRGYSLPVLGEVLREKSRKDPIGAMLNKWEGRLPANSADNTCYVAENIRNHSRGASRILVTSDMGKEESAVLAAAVQNHLPEITFVAAGSLLKDAVALKELALCDGVLCMVSRDRTAGSSINKELQLIRECDKATLGFVFIA